MKKLLYLLTFIQLVAVQPAAAQRPWKEYLIPGTAMLFAGMLEGTDEALVYHYQNGFKRVFPKANDQFWNPAISYKNKFKNHDENQGEAFFGSTDCLVALTDGHHLMRLSRVFMDLGAVSYCMNRQPAKTTKIPIFNWKTVAQDFIVLSVIRTIGFHIAYDGVFYADPNFLAKK